MANLGQVKRRLLLENGIAGQFTFQAADGIREDGPLLAVSEVNAKGNPAWFDGEKSYILPANSKELSQLRAIIRKMEKKIPLHLKNGVFKLKAWEPNAAEAEALFARPGAKR